MAIFSILVGQLILKSILDVSSGPYIILLKQLLDDLEFSFSYNDFMDGYFSRFAIIKGLL